MRYFDREFMLRWLWNFWKEPAALSKSPRCREVSTILAMLGDDIFACVRMLQCEIEDVEGLSWPG